MFEGAENSGIGLPLNFRATMMSSHFLDIQHHNPGSDNNCFLDQVMYFRLFQYDGTPLTDEEKGKHQVLQQQKPRNCVTRRMHILGRDRFYSKLYRLGKDIGDIYYKNRDTSFLNMSSQVRNYTKYIGEYLYKDRYKVSKGDIHNSPNVEMKTLAMGEEYKDR